jgi:hypothetical protein
MGSIRILSVFLRQIVFFFRGGGGPGLPIFFFFLICSTIIQVFVYYVRICMFHIIIDSFDGQSYAGHEAHEGGSVLAI